VSRRTGMTLAGFAYRKAGMRRGNRALVFLAMYGIAREKAGEPIGMESFAVEWKVSLAKAYRDREAFQVVFGDLEVEALWQDIRRQVAERQDLRGAAADVVSAVPSLVLV
jgi:hypothetical protein